MRHILLVVSVIFPIVAHAVVTLGQLDDFQNVTVQNWSRGGVAFQPANVSSLISVGTLVRASTFMTRVAQMRLIHGPQPFSLLGDDMIGNLGG